MNPFYPQNLADLDKHVPFTIVLNTERFQVIHTEISEQRCIIVLIRIVEFELKSGSIYTIKKFETTVVHGFEENVLPSEVKYIIDNRNFVQNPPVIMETSPANEDYHEKSLINFNVNVIRVTSDFPSPIPVYLYETEFDIDIENQNFHTSIFIDDIETPNTGSDTILCIKGQICQGQVHTGG